jgi:hypothetical protein
MSYSLRTAARRCNGAAILVEARRSALIVASARVLIAALTSSLATNYAGALAADRSSQPILCEDIDSVGRATMSADGTITLQLRSLWPDPIVESELVFPPEDLQYEEIKHHLGGIKPGESKPVPPFCGLNSEQWHLSFRGRAADGEARGLFLD